MSHLRTKVCLAMVLLTVAASARMTRADEPEEAVKVFQTVRPSVVSIDNSEGSGTGVLVDSTGLILTCAHVVISPIPYEVKVDIGTADEPKVVVFKKVQIVGYHPERDLALIRIDPKEQNITLTPAAISKDKATSGQRIYAIGDPGVDGGETILTKTITQGIVSGVDREFDQQKFYQIDAAINPGNSGGPVVDHNGKVLGLVTFKISDMEATNFAVPLRDVDLTKFVPLTEHKANPQRAAEMVKYAKQFNQLAQQAKADEGPQSETYKKYTFYAAYCYSEALVDDPSNPDVYTAIGAEFIVMDMSESAAAYLVRAIEIRPWGLNNAQTYHELGVAYKKQKIDDKAITAWKEGLAKFPYSASLWDDQACYYMEQEDYPNAAYSASVSLACGARKSRITLLQKIVRDARAKMDDGDLVQLAKKVDHDHLCDTLDKMRVKSNKSRKQRSLYMTVAFIDLMKEVGNLDVPGVEDRISQVPLRAPEGLAVGEDVADPGVDAGDVTTPKTKKKEIAIDDNTDADDTPVTPKKKVTPANDATADDTPAPTPRKKKKVDPELSDNSTDTASTDGGFKEIAKGPDNKGGDDWLGGNKKNPTTQNSAGKSAESTAPPTPVQNIVAPTPAVTGIDLAGEVQTVDDAKVVPLDVDKEEIVDAAFAGDGSFAYVLQKDGLLRKVAVPSLKESRQTNLASACEGIGMTKKGLAVYVNSAKEIWLLDASTLEVKGRVSIPGVVRIATALSSSRILVSTGPNDLELVDPSAEKVIAKFSPDQLTGAPGPVNFSLFALSPDGKEMFCTASESLCEFGISESSITFISAGPKLGADAQSIEVSPDSKYVAMPCKGGNSNIAGETQADFATYVFKITDMQKPIMTIPSGQSPRLLAFDFPARQLYAQNNQKQLIVYSPTGEKIKDYVFNREKDASTQKLLVHPAGRSILILTGGQLDWVTLP